jgi:hypothetical protein
MNLLSLKSSKKSFFNYILEDDGKLGKKSYLIYLFMYILITPLILSKVEYFPDYKGYEKFVEHGIYYLLYREPLSAISMLLFTWTDLSAKEYYMFSWMFTSILIFMIPIYLGKRYIVLSVFLLLNPFTLILFQTPRSFMAYPLFILALIITVRYRVLFILFATMFHIFSGPYSAFILYIMKFKKSIFSILLFIALLFLIFGAYGYWNHYIVHGSVHGQGRLLLFVFFVMVMIALSINKNNTNILVLVSILIFTVLSYKTITPAARLIPYLFAIVVLYSFTKFKKIDSLIVIHTLFVSYILISFYVVIGGMFGYGKV